MNQFFDKFETLEKTKEPQEHKTVEDPLKSCFLGGNVNPNWTNKKTSEILSRANCRKGILKECSSLSFSGA